MELVSDGWEPPQSPTNRERLAYLRRTCELLWPPPAEVTLDDTGSAVAKAAAALRLRGRRPGRSSGTDFLLIPGVHKPRLLVPTAPRAAAAALRHYGQPRTRTGRTGATALTMGLASGLGGRVLGTRVRVTAPPGTDSIEAYLKNVLSRDMRVSMRLGPARANRKPVLQLLTPAGEPVAFAKIGTNSLTRELVRAEHDSLARLNKAGLTEMAVPRVLHYGRWNDCDVLVLSALPMWLRRRPLAPARLVAAMGEVARVDGLRREPFDDNAYLRHLWERLVAADDGPERAALLDALATLVDRMSGTRLTYGAWHGDLTPWNMASTARGLLVWDWERFASGVPLGFDALHHWLQSEVGQGRRQAAAADCASWAPRLLSPFGVEAAEARLTSMLYLADLATRYLVDRQAKTGAQNGAPGKWLIPAIRLGMATL
jgi:hypothetical protein